MYLIVYYTNKHREMTSGIQYTQEYGLEGQQSINNVHCKALTKASGKEDSMLPNQLNITGNSHTHYTFVCMSSNYKAT